MILYFPGTVTVQWQESSWTNTSGGSAGLNRTPSCLGKAGKSSKTHHSPLERKGKYKGLKKSFNSRFEDRFVFHTMLRGFQWIFSGLVSRSLSRENLEGGRGEAETEMKTGEMGRESSGNYVHR